MNSRVALRKAIGSIRRMGIGLKQIAPNMSELDVGNYLVLFSYSTPVAYLDKSSGQYFKTDERFSNTTSRHISKWLAGNPADTVPQSEIESLVG